MNVTSTPSGTTVISHVVADGSDDNDDNNDNDNDAPLARDSLKSKNTISEVSIERTQKQSTEFISTNASYTLTEEKKNEGGGSKHLTLAPVVDANPAKRRRVATVSMTKEQFDVHEQEVEMTRRMPFEDDVDDWIPPQEQSGDGKTLLNEKYGY